MLLWLERRACKHRGCEASLNHLGWGRVLGCYLGSCFSGFVLLVVLWGSFFGFVLFGRSSRGSCFWVRSLGSSFGGSCVFFFDAYKVLEGVCGKVRGFLCKDSKKFATMQIYTLKIFLFALRVFCKQSRKGNNHRRLRVFVWRQKNAFRVSRFIFNLQYVYGMFH